MSIEEYFGDWLDVFDVYALKSTVSKLNKEYSEHQVTPSYKDIFKAFRLCTKKDCKCVFMGQDVYPQKGVATGILFGNKVGTINLSPSLEIIKEAVINYEVEHGTIDFDCTLESWGNQGILMLNSALTCEVNKVGSHSMLWRPFISKFLSNLSNSTVGMLYVLFGTQAETFKPYINEVNNTVIKVAHPAYYARVKQKMPREVFLYINDFVKRHYGESIKWY